MLEEPTLLATFVVNSTTDALNPPFGYTTLRSAVVAANAQFDDDNIVLPADGVMNRILERGVRRPPGVAEVDALFAGYGPGA